MVCVWPLSRRESKQPPTQWPHHQIMEMAFIEEKTAKRTPTPTQTPLHLTYPTQHTPHTHTHKHRPHPTPTNRQTDKHIQIHMYPHSLTQTHIKIHTYTHM